MNQIETVLGKDWYEQEKGRELKEMGEKFEKKLINHYKMCVKRPKEMANVKDSFNFRDQIFSVKKDPGAESLELIVQFEDDVVTLFKEIRNFNWLDVKIPHVLKFKAEEATLIYPYVVSLKESLRTYK